MPRRRYKKKENINLDFIWSKGFNLIDNYALTETGFKNNDEEIKKAIKKHNDIIYIKSGSDVITFSKYLELIDKPKIFLFTDGDEGFPSSYPSEIVEKIINCPMMTKLYVQNLEREYEKIKPFPIGLDLHTKGWRIGKKPINKVEYMLKLNYQKDKKDLILIDCYMSRDRHSDREKSIKILENCQHINILKERKSIGKILKLYSEHKFVLSPHGAGLDCHRTWEVLLAGSTPIVKTSILDSLYQDLPVIIVKDWEECKDLNFLLDKYNQLKTLTNREYIKGKFSYSYWLNK